MLVDQQVEVVLDVHIASGLRIAADPGAGVGQLRVAHLPRVVPHVAEQCLLAVCADGRVATPAHVLIDVLGLDRVERAWRVVEELQQLD
ncbi:hypothetical protein D9M70_550360 [compost metagenome]